MVTSVRTKLYSTKEHYEKLWEKVNELPEPTINDAVRIMQEMGNAGWIDANPYITDPKFREESFKPQDFFHEIFHLAANAGHTPYQEGFAGAMQIGFMSGFMDNVDWAYDKLHFHLSSYERDKAEYYGKENYREQIHKIRYQKRDTAIHFTAGMYLYQKLNTLTNEGFHEKSYQEKLSTLEQYSEDETLLPQRRKQSLHNLNQKGIGNLPASALQLSCQEWRSIIAVATGLHDAKDTPYPKRLEPIQRFIKEAMVKYDISKPYKGGKHAKNILEKRLEKEIESGPLHGWDGERER